MEASHKTHRPHIKVGKDEEEEEGCRFNIPEILTSLCICIGGGGIQYFKHTIQINLQSYLDPTETNVIFT